MQPTPGQLRQIQRKYGMFCHFGMNTYLDLEWSDGSGPATTFAPPADLPAKIDTWAQLARDAGMRFLILTTKHHDGFCLWPTALTDYHCFAPGIANKIDIVGTAAEACRRHGIEFAMYYSIWDRHEPGYRDKDPHVYIEWMKKQLDELLTRYGPVCELWLDGQWDRKAADWFLPEVYARVKSHQPACQVGQNVTMGKRPWQVREGDEVAYFPTDFRLCDPYLPPENDPKVFMAGGKSVYLPFEATVTMSPIGNWFAHEADPHACEVDTLEEVVYRATANDNILVINVSPRKTGELFPETRKNLAELARRLGIRTDAPFPRLPEPRNATFRATVRASSTLENDRIGGLPPNAVDSDPLTAWQCGEPSGWIEISLREPATLNRIVLIEGTSARIGRFTIEADVRSTGSSLPSQTQSADSTNKQPQHGTANTWHLILEGNGLSDPRTPTPSFSQRGYAKLQLPKPITAQHFRLTIHDSIAPSDGKATPAIYQFSVHME